MTRRASPDATPAARLDAAPESPVRLDLNGHPVVTWLCTPERLEALAAGWLRCEGAIRERAEIATLEADPVSRIVRAEVPAEAVARLGGGAGRPGAGGRPVEPGDVAAEPPRLSARLARLLADGAELRALFAAMYERAPLRERGGGLHTGGWVAEGKLVEVVEDVSRQNVVDKLVGAALLEGRPAGDALLLLSGRISGSIAAKAWRTGVAALASLSIPTTLARDLAARAGITLVGRARGEPQVHRPG